MELASSHTNPEGPSQASSLLGPFGAGGSGQACSERRHQGGLTCPRPVCQSDLHGPQKGGVCTPCSQLEAIEQVCGQEEVQDGELGCAEGSDQAQRLDDLDRPQRCIPFSPNGCTPPEAPSLHVQGSPIRVPVSPLRADQCPAYLHKGNEARHGSPTSPRYPVHDFSGRSSPTVLLKGRAGRNHQGGDHPASAVGLPHKRGEVDPAPNSENGLPGFSPGLSPDDEFPTPGQAGGNSGGLQEDTGADPCVGAGHGEADWEDVASDSPGPVVLPQLTKGKECCLQSLSVVRCPSSLGPTCETGHPVVDGGGAEMERQTHSSEASRPGGGVGCITAGMGCFSGRSSNGGPLVSSRETQPHQCPRDDSRDICSPDVRQGTAEYSGALEDGQYISCVIRESPRRNALVNPVPEGKGALVVVSGQRDQSLGRVPPWGEQHDSGLPIKAGDVLGVDVGPRGILPASPDARLLQGRPVRNTPEHTVDTVCSVEARPLRDGDGCPRDIMVRSARICVSPLQPRGEMSAQAGNGGVNNSASSTCMASPVMVPTSSGVCHRPPSSPPMVSLPSPGPIRPAAPSSPVSLPPSRRLEGLRQKLTEDGVSPLASELISAAWSKGTNNAYQSAWLQWRSWCTQRNSNPFSSDVSSFANFLASLFRKGLQHRSINTIRSAVSVTHNNVEGTPVGQHPVITRLMKGIYNSRPPQPRYSSSWDVAKVTGHLRGMGPNPELSLKQLTLKLVILMALVEASRSSELAALDLRFRVYSPEGVSFTLPTLTKKRKAGAPPRKLFFGGFPPDSKLCVIHCLREYEARSARFRENDQGPNSSDRLFRSYVKPHKAVSSQRVAKWIKLILKEAGVDTGIFSAHSTRGASATAAARQGVSTAQILEVADWSTEGTFRKFYYRPSNDPSFAHGVLSDGT